MFRRQFIDVTPDVREAVDAEVATLAAGHPSPGDELPADWHPQGPTPAEVPIVFCGMPDADMVEAAILLGHGGLLQLATRECIIDALHQASRLATCSVLCFSIRSVDLYGTALAGSITAGLARLAVEDREEASLAKTVLDELVQNAIVHGNLGLPSRKLNSMDDIEDFNADIAARLADPSYGTKHVGIAFWRASAGWVVEVVDDGDGYDSTRVNVNVAGNFGYSGRGSHIIRSLSKAVHIDCGGRRTLVRF